MARDVEVDKSGVPVRKGMPTDERPTPISISSKRQDRPGLTKIKTGANRRGDTQRTRTGVTFTVSFTLTSEVDQLIHDMAIEQGVSRSSVVRSAILLHAMNKGFGE